MFERSQSSDMAFGGASWPLWQPGLVAVCHPSKMIAMACGSCALCVRNARFVFWAKCGSDASLSCLKTLWRDRVPFLMPQHSRKATPKATIHVMPWQTSYASCASQPLRVLSILGEHRRLSGCSLEECALKLLPVLASSPDFQEAVSRALCAILPGRHIERRPKCRPCSWIRLEVFGVLAWFLARLRRWGWLILISRMPPPGSAFICPRQVATCTWQCPPVFFHPSPTPLVSDGAVLWGIPSFLLCVCLSWGSLFAGKAKDNHPCECPMFWDKTQLRGGWTMLVWAKAKPELLKTL